MIQRRSILCRLLGTLAVILGALSLVMSVAPAQASPVYDETQFDAHLKDTHHGSSNPGFATGGCPASDQPYGWHFLLPGNDTEFVSIRVTFENAGEITTFVSDPTPKHAYVFTSGPDTVRDAVATTNGGSQTVFNLSHVCTPEDTTSTTPTTQATTSSTSTSTSTSTSSTSTSTSTSTTTSTTSTTQQTPTTEEETTTTVSVVVLPTSIVQSSTSSTDPTKIVPSSETSLTRATVLGVQQPRQLPRTGFEPDIALLGFVLLASGATALGQAQRLELRRMRADARHLRR